MLRKLFASPLWFALLFAACGGGESGSDEPGSGAGAGGSGATSTASGSGGSGAPKGGTSSASSGGKSTGTGAGTGSSGGGGAPEAPSAACQKTGDGKTTFVFVNRCDEPINYRGSLIDGGTLEPGASACADLGSDVETISSIRYWGFGAVDPGPEHHTLAEFTLNTDFNDFDWYNLSHVDAHNLPMQIVPLDMDDCRTLTCEESLLEGCPEAGKVRDEDGNVIACYSLDRDDPTSEVARYFEESCDDSYSWSGDDAESMAACAGEDYAIVFCPAG
jgi:hypothetical protein